MSIDKLKFKKIDVPSTTSAPKVVLEGTAAPHSDVVVENQSMAVVAPTETADTFVHAKAGALCLSVIERCGRRGLAVLARDHGPGIADCEQALVDGYSTSSGLGLGLPSARRLMDEFMLDSRPGEGTEVNMIKWVP